MKEGRTKVAITGAGGYVGSGLGKFLRREGHDVLELRRDAERGRPDHVHHDLRGGVGPDSLRGVELLIHCAHDFSCRGLEEMMRVNFDGSTRLFDSTHAAGVPRVVFVSTMSSFRGCRSEYGRVKLATEAEAARRGVIIVRPGLVFGVDSGGMIGSLSRLVRDRRILPLVGNGQHELHVCHIDDLGRLVLAAGKRPAGEIRDPLIAAEEQALTFKRILQRLAEAQGRRVHFVPVPWRLIWFGLIVVERLGLNLRFRSDSLIGLVNSDPHPDFSSTRALGVSFRGLDAATASS